MSDLKTICNCGHEWGVHSSLTDECTAIVHTWHDKHIESSHGCECKAFMHAVENVTAPDTVNHPPHYNAHPSGIECIDVVEHMGFNVGNAIKYLWRADHKGAAIEDLKKSAWYIQREIERRSK